MQALLVLTVVSAAAASPQLLYGGYGGAYPYALASPLTYTYTPQVTKYVPKEVEIPVEHIQYVAKETGCKNVFGLDVPCLTEGEARRKRSADEEEAAEAAPAAAATVLAAGYHPLAYAGYGYAGLPYAGYGYAGLPYVAAPAVKVAEPEVTEVEVPHYVYKPVVKEVALNPLCHNGLGFPVPCA